MTKPVILDEKPCDHRLPMAVFHETACVGTMQMSAGDMGRGVRATGSGGGGPKRSGVRRRSNDEG